MLNYPEKWGFSPVDVNPHPRGDRAYVFSFLNGYAASVIPDGPGGRELAVLAADPAWGPMEWPIVHVESITGSADAVIRLSEDEVGEYLTKIYNLPRRER